MMTATGVHAAHARDSPHFALQILFICGAAATCATLYVVAHLEHCPHTGRLRVIFQSPSTDTLQGQRAFAQIKRSAAVFPPTRCAPALTARASALPSLVSAAAEYIATNFATTSSTSTLLSHATPAPNTCALPASPSPSCRPPPPPPPPPPLRAPCHDPQLASFSGFVFML
jgi:hypothetical protein